MRRIRARMRRRIRPTDESPGAVRDLDRFPLTPGAHQVQSAEGARESRQHAHVVIAGDGEHFDARGDQPTQSRFERRPALEVALFVVDDIAEQHDGLHALLDRAIDRRLPRRARTERITTTRACRDVVGNTARTAPEVDVTDGEDAECHGGQDPARRGPRRRGMLARAEGLEETPDGSGQGRLRAT